MTDILTIKDVSKSFGRKQVLKNFELKLEKGKFYGLLGKNGEGKTTLIRLLMGVIPPDKGELFYKDKRITSRQSSYKREIGYIAEDCIFYGWMTVKELLAFNSSFYPRWNNAKAEEYLKRFSLYASDQIKKMSRGMKLKLGLITALAAEPELLILDDPTSGMDVPTRHDFLKEIISRLSEAGTTMLFCTHMVHEIEGVIEKLGILDSGNLILDKDYQTVKESIKRIRLQSSDKEFPETIPLDGILTDRGNGHHRELVIYPWDSEQQQKLESLGCTGIEIESLSLEEIFLSFVTQLHISAVKGRTDVG